MNRRLIRSCLLGLATLGAFAGSVTLGFSSWYVATRTYFTEQRTIGVDASVTSTGISLAEAGLAFSEGTRLDYNAISARPITDETGASASVGSAWSNGCFDMLLTADYSESGFLKQVPWDDPNQFALQLDCKTANFGSAHISSGSLFSKNNEDYYFSLYDSNSVTSGYDVAYLLPIRTRNYLSIYCLCQMTTQIKMDAGVQMLLRFQYDDYDVPAALESESKPEITIRISLLSKTQFLQRKA